VSKDGDRFKFNTSIAALMILVNELEELETVPKSALTQLVIMLAPFAPYLAEHLWTKLDEEGSVHQQLWPDASVTVANEVKVVVQVNGKRRGLITLAINCPEDDAIVAARAIPSVIIAVAGKEQKRVVYVQNKIINIVV
jgi:leucyl-tRNA synthetase